MIDEEETDLQQLGKGTLYSDILIASLLLMDDIALLAESAEDLQDMLDTTYQYACKYHQEFGVAKCKVMVMNTSRDFDHTTWRLGHFQLPTCRVYKWLGVTVTPNISSSKDHIDVKRQLITAALQLLGSGIQHQHH